MKVKIWGARGSIPTPITSLAIRDKMINVLEKAKGVDLDDPMAIRAYLDSLHPLETGTTGGDTACVEIQADDQVIILDAGSGIRALGQELMNGPCGRGEGVLHLFFSHTHWDHIQGFPFFIPAYVPGNRIYIYGVHQIAPPLTDQMKPATFPIALRDLQSTIEFIPLSERQVFMLGNIQVSNMRLHHPGDAYAYRFEYQGNVFVYATDVECKKVDDVSLKPLINFFAGADAVIFDSQFTLRESLVKDDWGHSSALIGAEIARRAKVKRLILFHHDPTTSDEELIKIVQETRVYQAKYEAEPTTQILAGRESLTLNLTPPQPFSLSSLSTPETAILLITEDFDQQTVSQVVDQLTDPEQNPSLPKLIVDLSEVKQLYMAGLRSLIDLRSVWKGRPMALAAVSTQAQEIIELTNCLDLFSIYPSVKMAREALEAQEALRLPGQVIKDRYHIESKIRENDIGTVFKATDTRLERLVSLMVLSPTLSQTTIQRLLQQAQKSARLQTANIVTLFDADEDRGVPYLVMEYAHAPTLRTLIDAGSSPLLLQIALGITQALEYAHSKGVFHGNLRPSNILISDIVKLADFGLRLLDEQSNLSDKHIVMNNFLYLAPEQVAGQAIDARTDLFALGVILYQLSTGQPPFEAGKFDRAPIPPRQLNSTLSRSFEHLILKLLAIEVDQRYETAAQVRQVLSNLDVDSASLPQETDLVQSFPKFTLTEPSPATAPELIPQRRGKLIGREQEIQLILKLWSLAEHGRGQMLLIGGEAGIGKTRLTEEVEREIEHGITLVGRCSEFEGNPPYQPFVEIGRNYLAKTPAETFRRQLGDTAAASNLAAALAPLITDIYEIVPDLKPLSRLPPDQEEARLKNSLVQFIRRSAVSRPWMVILDDLHWSDPSSLQLLHYLARHVDDLPLLIVGTYRDVELDMAHPLRDLMSTLSRLPIYHQISLRRLDKDQVGQMLEEMWQQEVPEEWVTAIYERAGGNPFYIKEVTKTLVDEGVVTFEDGVWHFSKVVKLKLPQKIRDVVLRRVKRVSGPTQELLHQAAVLGQQFNFSDLLATSNQSEDGLLVSLDEAMSHNLIREIDSAAGLAFSNVEIQQVIYESLSQLRRRMLHRHVGKTLESFYQDKLEPVSGRLAYHFMQAGDSDNAFTYSLKAGQHAQSLYAYQTALRWYTQAADLLPEDRKYTVDCVALYRGLGDMLQTETRFLEAIDAYQTMSLAAKTTNNTKAQVQALYLLAATYNSQGEYQMALEMAKQTEEAARMAKTQEILARALYEQGWALLSLGDTEAGLAVGEQLLTFSTTIDATYEVGQSLNLLASVHRALGNYSRAIDYQQQGLMLYRELGDRNRVSVMLNNLGESYYLQEDYQSAASLYQEALMTAREIGDRASEILYRSNLSAARVGLGDYAAAEADLFEVIQMPETVRSANLAEIHRNLAEARLGQHKLTEALAEAQLALALSQETNAPETTGLAWRTLGRVAAQQAAPVTMDERTYTPADCFSESLQTFTEMNMAGERVRTLRAWTAYERAQGHVETAGKLRQEVDAILATLKKSGV